MDQRRRLQKFVLSLVDEPMPAGFRNPYAAPEAANNLLVFLRDRDPHERTLLFVGEAPGYRGAALSGVAFSSLQILVSNWQDPWRSFGPEAGYEVPEAAKFYRESTATMVWEIFAEHLGSAPLPLTWNAVPFHPWRDQLDSNAPLRRKSVSIGRRWIEELLNLYPNAIPVAVGLRAHDALTTLGITHAALRHPSMGGKQRFAKGVQDLAASLA